MDNTGTSGRAGPKLLQAPTKAMGPEPLVRDLPSGKNDLVQRDDNILSTHLLSFWGKIFLWKILKEVILKESASACRERCKIQPERK